MATELSSFAELKKAASAGAAARDRRRRSAREVDAQGRAYATGRRKNAVARVWVKPGTGKITVNGRDQKVYFARPTQQMVIQQPFDVSSATSSSTWSPPSPAAACRARPARCATASPRRSPSTSRACAAP